MILKKQKIIPGEWIVYNHREKYFYIRYPKEWLPIIPLSKDASYAVAPNDGNLLLEIVAYKPGSDNIDYSMQIIELLIETLEEQFTDLHVVSKTEFILEDVVEKDIVQNWTVITEDTGGTPVINMKKPEKCARLVVEFTDFDSNKYITDYFFLSGKNIIVSLNYKIHAKRYKKINSLFELVTNSVLLGKFPKS